MTIYGTFKRYQIRMHMISEDGTYYDDDLCMRPMIRVVGQQSPFSDRIAAQRIAEYFRREFRYDFVQYQAKEKVCDKDRVILFTHEDYTHRQYAFGAVCMRWRAFKGCDPGWSLAWVWLHPFERNQGHLKRLWPDLNTRFPGFRIEGPLSRAMDGFLAKNDPGREIW